MRWTRRTPRSGGPTPIAVAAMSTRRPSGPVRPNTATTRATATARTRRAYRTRVANRANGRVRRVVAACATAPDTAMPRRIDANTGGRFEAGSHGGKESEQGGHGNPQQAVHGGDQRRGCSAGDKESEPEENEDRMA